MFTYDLLLRVSFRCNKSARKWCSSKSATKTKLSWPNTTIRQCNIPQTMWAWITRCRYVKLNHFLSLKHIKTYPKRHDSIVNYPSETIIFIPCLSGLYRSLTIARKSTNTRCFTSPWTLVTITESNTLGRTWSVITLNSISSSTMSKVRQKCAFLA